MGGTTLFLFSLTCSMPAHLNPHTQTASLPAGAVGVLTIRAAPQPPVLHAPSLPGTKDRRAPRAKGTTVSKMGGGVSKVRPKPRHRTRPAGGGRKAKN